MSESQRLLEGEGLVNDAVAIVAYGIALETLTTGKFETTHALLALLEEVPIGVAVGLAAGWIAGVLSGRVDSVPLEIGISLATTYPAYHLADRLGGSTVLAVVTLGIMLRSSSARVSSPVARLAARTVWSFLRYASTALVFLLLGLLIGEIAVDWPGWPLVRTGFILAAALSSSAWPGCWWCRGWWRCSVCPMVRRRPWPSRSCSVGPACVAWSRSRSRWRWLCR